MGCGHELRKMVGRFKRGCQCKSMVAKMNKQGPTWCKRRRRSLVKWLSSERPDVDADSVIDEAIRRVEEMDLRDFFERVYVISLARRPERHRQFLDDLPEDWPFKHPLMVHAIDGKLCPNPPRFKRQGAGAWGCFRTHHRLIEDCLNDGVESVLLLEDDARCVPGFAEKVRRFLTHVPDDWGSIYLGGEHLRASVNVPKQVNEEVFVPFNVNRTHAWSLRGETMKEVYRHLNRVDWHKGHHIDHHLGRLHQRRSSKHRVYCPKAWLIGQRENKSDIVSRSFDERFWTPAKTLAGDKPPFVAVVGLHSSGSSCLAGVLHHLGVHMGNDLGGYWDRHKGGFEAKGLASIMEDAVSFPDTKYSLPRGQIFNRLRSWIAARHEEAEARGTIAGGKYPQLCRTGDQLINICGPGLRVVFIDRPIEESIASLQRRCPRAEPDQLREHQEWLERGKGDLALKCPKERQIRVDYHSLLSDPWREVGRLMEFLQIGPWSDSSGGEVPGFDWQGAQEAAVAHVERPREEVAA